MSAVSVARLVGRQAGADAAALVTVAVLVLVTALLAAAVPRQLSSTADAALRDAVGSAPAAAREISAAASNDRSPAQLPAVDALLVEELATPGTDLLVPGAYGATTGLYDTLRPASSTPFRDQPFAWLQLRHQSGLLDEVRWTDGRPPGRVAVEGVAGRQMLALDIAVARSIAATLDLRLGDRIDLSPQSGSTTGGAPVRVTITGLFEPVDRAEPAWGYAGAMLTAGRELTPSGDLLAEYGTALISRSQLDALQETTLVLNFDWHYPVRPGALDAANVAGVLATIERATAQGVLVPRSPGDRRDLGVQPAVTVSSAVPALLQQYLAQRGTAQAVSAMVLVGLFVLALLVLGLATQLGVQGRRVALALVRARGASTLQLVGVLAVEVFVVAACGAAVGYAAAIRLVPARASALSVGLVAAVVCACVVFVVLGSWRAHGSRAGDGRADLVAARGSRRRAVTEVFVVLLGLGGLVLLRRRGLGASTDADLYLAAVPVLLALGAGVLAMRAYPLLLRPLVRPMGRRAGAVGFVALARAARQPVTTVLPLAVLLLGLGFSVFASAVETTVTRGQVDAAFGAVGADYRLEAPGFAEEQVRRVAATAGVDAAVPAFAPDEASLVLGDGSRAALRFLAVDPRAYAELVADFPGAVDYRAGLGTLVSSPGPAGAGDPADSADPAALPALVSQGVADVADGGTVRVELGAGAGDKLLRVDAVAARLPTDGGGDFAVVDIAALRAVNNVSLAADEVFVRAPAAAAPALRATVEGLDRDIVVTDRAEALAGIRESPVVAGTVTAFRLGTAAAAGYCFLAVSLALVLTARTRGRLLSAMRTLGMGRGQARALMALELAPTMVVVALTGLAVGVALPHLLVPAVDLTPFTGGALPPPTQVDPSVAGLLGGGLGVLVALAVLASTALERRRGLGRVARVGVDL